MVVAAHGNVDEYCAAHGMIIYERHEGDVTEYRGSCLVLVTDNCEDLNDYYYRKYQLLRRNIELVSTHWGDESVDEFVRYMSDREAAGRKKRYGGRVPFGFKKVKGVVLEDPESIEIARRIVTLRDQGWKYKEIQADEGVRYPDGRVMPLSTIQVILRNREKYE